MHFKINFFIYVSVQVRCVNNLRMARNLAQDAKSAIALIERTVLFDAHWLRPLRIYGKIVAPTGKILWFANVYVARLASSRMMWCSLSELKVKPEILVKFEADFGTSCIHPSSTHDDWIPVWSSFCTYDGSLKEEFNGKLPDTDVTSPMSVISVVSSSTTTQGFPLFNVILKNGTWAMVAEGFMIWKYPGLVLDYWKRNIIPGANFAIQYDTWIKKNMPSLLTLDVSYKELIYIYDITCDENVM